MHKSILFLWLLSITLFACTTRDMCLVQTTNGMVEGAFEQEVFVWKGIPYAKPPVNELRWKAPQRPDNWEGIRQAKQYSNICPQTGYGDQSIYEIPAEPMSEDCLYLNVWSPNPTKDKLPVMVWIHGGSLTREGGSHPQYLGYNMAKKGMVYVSINYRLNAFGFMAHPELSKENENGVSGNYGILDQIAALEWVKENIEQFGGDPNQVTIAGESAGGWSVTLLMATPKAQGLFHRAILQSGAYMWSGPKLKSGQYGYEAAELNGQKFMNTYGAQTLPEMRAISADSLVAGVFDTQTIFNTEINIDGFVFEDNIDRIYADGKQNKVDILVGGNADEWSLWIPSSLPKDVEVYTAQAQTLYADRAELFLKAYPATDSTSIAQAYADYQSDQYFHLHSRLLATEVAKAGNEVYMYYFAKAPAERYPAKYGAFHGAEIVYVLDNLDNDPGPVGSGIISKEDKAYADLMSAYWANFVKTGDPNSLKLPEWPTWDEQHQRYLSFDEMVEAKQYLLKERLDGLQAFLDAKK